MKCFFVTVIYLDFASSMSMFGRLWSYNDETAWPGGQCKRGGKRQSPIDIRTRNVVKDFDQQFIKYGPIKFIGYDNVLLTGINNGYTIQFSTEGDKSMHPKITGGPLQFFYRLEQLHFHWVSEHSINGVKFPMEIHLVHVRSDLKVSEALSKRDGLAIISVFCNVKPELNDKNNEVFDEIMEHIPLLLRAGDVVSGVILDVRKMLSRNKNSYYSYLGSLTSPECNEVVVWIIFDKPIYISEAHYRQFSKIGVGRHNFRSLQKLNHHLVFQPPDSFITTPQGITVAIQFFKRMSEFFKNVTRFVIKGLKSA